MAVRSYARLECQPAPEGTRMLEGELPGTVGECVDAWLGDLEIGGASALTVKQYRWKARRALPLDSPVYALSTALLRGLVADCVRTRAPASAATFWGTMRSFTKYLYEQGITPTNLMSGVPRPRVPEPQSRCLSQEALARLWAAACELDGGGPPEIRTQTVTAFEAAPSAIGVEARDSEATSAAAQRDGLTVVTAAGKADRTSLRARASHFDSTTYRLLYLLLASTGLRRAEVAGARYEDIEGDTLRVLGKGRRWRRVLLTEQVLSLMSCDAKRHNVTRKVTGPIFGGIGPSRIGQLFEHIARRAGVQTSCHGLRHTWATEALRAGMQMEACRVLGGWSDFRQLSQRYGKSAIEEAALVEARRVANSPRIGP